MELLEAKNTVNISKSFTENRLWKWVRRVLGLDQAIVFSVLARVWSSLAGLVTVILIAHFLSPAEQGYYYTFGSLVALQVVFELGFSFVILQMASHESVHLTISADGRITGDAVPHARLASVLQKSVRWYSVAALLMLASLLPAGVYFFSTHSHPGQTVGWRLPWYSVVVAATLTFQIDPVFSFLEGCGYVAQVAQTRFWQKFVGSLLAWTALLTHYGLFAPAMMIFGQALAGSNWLLGRRHLIIGLLRHAVGPHKIRWGAEVWPFQWKMAVTFFFSYFISQLFSPVLFAYRGAVEAGRMGMSLTIAGALGAIAYTWIYTKASPFGNMIARRDFAALDRIFFQTLVQSGALLLGAEATFVGVLVVIARHFPRLASRMLPVPVFALLLFTVFLSHITFSEATYLRAHKQEPFLILTTLVAILIGVSTLLTGKLWGATGMTIGYFFCGGVFYLAGATYIFIKRRRLWHGSSPTQHRSVIV